ncbi:TPA: EAL domain-containing protein [Klebsiella pneumoniae]|nr:EAL domain-containing protein [Klebsiella pneumoniae]HBR4970812.1 EAL domain-containing protein [Klebsiella pneumoniae]
MRDLILQLSKSSIYSTKPCTDSINANVLNKIVSILGETHNEIIFEGIETEGQLSYLVANFPDAYVQGYFYAKPMNIEELKKYLDKKA